MDAFCSGIHATSFVHVKREQVAGGAMDAAPVGLTCDAAQSGCFLFCKRFLISNSISRAQQDSITALS
jgi:hypothetical protein